MKRSPMKRTAMRRRLTQRKAEGDAEYAIERDKRLVRARFRCEIQGPRCTQQATVTHHRMRRSHHLDHSADNLIACCGNCHEYVHAEVAIAKERGWIVTEWPQIEPRQTA